MDPNSVTSRLPWVLALAAGAAAGGAIDGGPLWLWGLAAVLLVASGGVSAHLTPSSCAPAPTPSGQEPGMEDLDEPDEPPSQAASLDPEIIGTMSHEIRTPLNGVLGMMQLLAETDLSAKQRNILQTVLDSGQVLSQLVDDYLAYYRFRTGQSPTPSPTPTELADTALQTLLLFQGLAFKKDLDLTLVSDPQAPFIVRTDSGRLRQILGNLVLNALKYTDAGEVCLSLEQRGATTVLSVSDTGPGLPPAELDTLFEPLHRVESTARSEKGAGLGLSISKQLVDVLDGELRVDSEVGVGTTFSIEVDFDVLVATPPDPPELPFETAAILGESVAPTMALGDILEQLGLVARLYEDAASMHSDAPDLAFIFSEALDPQLQRAVNRRSTVLIAVRWLSEPQARDPAPDCHVLLQPFTRSTVLESLEAIADGAARTSTVDRWRESLATHHPLAVLVAEDDDVSARVLTGMLEQFGYAPEVVTTGSAAVAALQSGDFDVALLDLNMPDFGGIGILERASDHRAWPIAVSASSRPEQRRVCLEAGFRDFLAKPLSAKALRAALAGAAARSTSVASANDSASDALNQLRDLFEANPEAYRELVGTQIQQIDLLCEDLRDGLQPAGNLETARRAAHTLKAGATRFGCDQVAHHAEILDSEWESLSHTRRREVVETLIDQWHGEERAALEAELDLKTAT